MGATIALRKVWNRICFILETPTKKRKFTTLMQETFTTWNFRSSDLNSAKLKYRRKYIIISTAKLKCCKILFLNQTAKIKIHQNSLLKIYDWKENVARINFICFPKTLKTTNIFSGASFCKSTGIRFHAFPKIPKMVETHAQSLSFNTKAKLKGHQLWYIKQTAK